MSSDTTVETLTGFKPGQKLLYLTELGGRPHMRIVTFRKEGDIGYIVLYVEEFDEYIEVGQLYSFESIKDQFDSYDDKEKRRWRAINDGILPAALLSHEETDKIIDKNEEWCKAYEERQREWSREDAEAELLYQIPEDQRHIDVDEDDDEDDVGGPSHVMGSSPTCQP